MEYLKLGTTLASREFGVVGRLVTLGTQLLLLFQNPVLILGGLALVGSHTRVGSPIIDKNKVSFESVISFVCKVSEAAAAATFFFRF